VGKRAISKYQRSCGVAGSVVTVYGVGFEPVGRNVLYGGVPGIFKSAKNKEV